MVSIRGMDMPDSCSECRFCIDSEDGYYESWCAAMKHGVPKLFSYPERGCCA